MCKTFIYVLGIEAINNFDKARLVGLMTRSSGAVQIIDSELTPLNIAKYREISSVVYYKDMIKTMTEIEAERVQIEQAQEIEAEEVEIDDE